MIPKVIIHCKGKEELDSLLKILEDIGYAWNGDGIKATKISKVAGNYIHVYDNEYGKVIRYSSVCPDQQFLEFESIKDNIAEILK